MSLQSLLANDSVSATVRSASHRDASGGIQAGGFVAVAGLPTSFPARVEDLSAQQMQAYAMRGMVVDTVVYTQQSGLGAGMYLTTSDGRVLQVEGTKYNRAIGGMPAFFEVRCSEYRPGA